VTITQASLPENGKVLIIGGGPGGTACALALHNLAAKMSRSIQITLIEAKQFSTESHYNQCAGVLSPPLPSLLESTLGVDFPHHICYGEINEYVIHSNGEQIRLSGEQETSYAVRRVQFDAYMLDQVLKRDIKVISVRAVDMEFHADKVVVYTENESYEADVIVGAFGLDEGTAAAFSRLTPYKPPQALDSIVVNYRLYEGELNDFSGTIHAFLPRNSHIEFGAVTPKCDHLTINIAGQSVNSPLMHNFLHFPEVEEILPNSSGRGKGNPKDLRFYKGRFPRSLARGYYGDRYVMIGDASGLVRAFKGKGATSAMQTGVRAAETILTQGITREAFHHHFQPANRDIIQDLPYGRGMRLATLFMSRVGVLDWVIRGARKNADLRVALFGAVSGHSPYQEILKISLRPKPIWAILRSVFRDR
jgi:flavin-dependent dehydrogenase